MAQATKEIGFLWAFCVSCLLINADEPGKRFLFFQFQNGETREQSCESFTEYKELIALENDGQCHSLDSVILKLRVLHARSSHLGPHCMHDVIEKMKTYYSSHHNTSGGCNCSGHVAYHPEKYHNRWTCKNQNHDFDVLYAELFGSDSKYGPCLIHNKVWVSLGSMQSYQTRVCQWEIIDHYSTIFDANGSTCTCMHENTHVNATPSHTDFMKTIALAHSTAPTDMKESTSSTFITTIIPTIPESVPTITASVLHTCKKVTTIGILAHGVQQSNHNAGNCHLETNDHQAPDALVMNMCNVSDAPETWTRGQNVMSVCASIPLYTPVATFFDGKYHSEGGHAGIFIGCLLDGFKIIVQECDQNITVMHLTTGHQPDPVNYFIIM